MSYIYIYIHTQGWAVFQIHVFKICIWNTKYYLYLNTFEKIKCILYLNTFNLSIFVFSKYIQYFLPINLFIRGWFPVSTSSDIKHATFIHVSCSCMTHLELGNDIFWIPVRKQGIILPSCAIKMSNFQFQKSWLQACPHSSALLLERIGIVEDVLGKSY